jgi:hypothetical protein
MRSKIMALFDSASIRRESLQYSMELAKRMNSILILLVILPFGGNKNPFNGIEPMIKRGIHAQDKLEKHVEAIRKAGVAVETAVRIGTPRSELVKYLAEAGRFEIIVWGGGPDLIKSRDHWLARMKDVLECPVVTPFVKTDAKIKHAGK